jgi:hypothetical protein
MTVKDLAERLKRENIPENCYTLEGGLPNEKWCLEKTPSGWDIYYSERGIRNQLRHLTSEEKACDYFYDELIKMMKYM